MIFGINTTRDISKLSHIIFFSPNYIKLCKYKNLIYYIVYLLF